MPYDEHDDSGKFKEKFGIEKVFDELRDADGGATTSEVAGAVGCSRRYALDKLTTLKDNGRVSAREVGNTFLWSTTDD